MWIQGLDGRKHSWNLTSQPKESCSSLHERSRGLLKELFPLDQISEEVSLPGSGGLTADFYLPSRRLMIEVQGEQHYKFNDHFHKFRLNFLASLKRDADKRSWCELNKITLIELPYDESDEQWRERIIGG